MRVLILLVALSTAACQPAISREQVDVTVADLIGAYDANEAAAQARFSGKDLIVTAQVDRVNLDGDNQPFVNLASNDTFLPVQLHFLPSAAGAAAGLVKGEEYRFRCASVSEMLGSPMLQDCELIS